jgi:hypothetical protein
MTFQEVMKVFEAKQGGAPGPMGLKLGIAVDILVKVSAMMVSCISGYLIDGDQQP